MNCTGRTTVKRWTLRMPSGDKWSFSNLHEWCRLHANLLEKDGPGEKYKKPLWLRAAQGLSLNGQWKGILVLAVGESRIAQRKRKHV
jgi:hypothetical protein